MFKNLFKGLSRDKSMTYDQAKEMARHEDTAVRRQLAARDDVKPEILYFLADDPSPEVRREIAGNESAPSQVDLLLAHDADEGVRTGIARKIAKLAPGLTEQEQDRVRHMANEALEILARDQVTRVRQILSETLKDVAHAPPEVIKRLARDAELVVSGPVLEFSPVLTDDDILEIIASDPVHGALSAISRRAEVGETVSDAIYVSNDTEAVTELLANPSAQIREETLDRIIDHAPDVEPWHAPLTRRPKLPATAAARLARFVAYNLIENMTERRDIPPEALDEVKAVVRRRLDEGDFEDAGGADAPPPAPKKDQAKASPDDLLIQAREMHQAGKLDEDTIAASLKSGDRDFVAAALAVRAGLPLRMIDKVISTCSVKGLVAVTWKAGLPMMLAVQLQQKLARITPKDVLYAKNGTDYPLNEQDMTWQLDFLKEL